MPNKNVKVDADAIDETKIKPNSNIAEDDYADIIDIINRSKEKSSYDEFSKKY